MHIIAGRVCDHEHVTAAGGGRVLWGVCLHGGSLVCVGERGGVCASVGSGCEVCAWCVCEVMCP